MASGPVARRYAKALLMIGVEQKKVEPLRAQLSQLAGLFRDSAELRVVLLNPSIRLEERKAVMQQIVDRVKVDPIMRNFAMLLLDKDRFRYCEAISMEFNRMADELEGVVRAKATSAKALNIAQRASVKKALEELTGKRVELEVDTDPALIGGVVARVGSIVYDGSVRTQLEMLKESILSEV
jgi:F-type H+-transporting ATPase subunit delta